MLSEKVHRGELMVEHRLLTLIKQYSHSFLDTSKASAIFVSATKCGSTIHLNKGDCHHDQNRDDT